MKHIKYKHLPAKLKRALAAVAEALDELSPSQWDALQDEEMARMAHLQREFQEWGLPNACGPDSTLGAFVLQLYSARHCGSEWEKAVLHIKRNEDQRRRKYGDSRDTTGDSRDTTVTGHA